MLAAKHSADRPICSILHMLHCERNLEPITWRLMLLNLTVSGVCLKALTHAAAALISAALNGSSGCWATLETISVTDLAKGCTPQSAA